MGLLSYIKKNCLKVHIDDYSPDLSQGLFDPVAITDLIRMVVLYLYGGVYFDLDMMFMRDITPLLDYQFTYRWSLSIEANTALIHFHKESNELGGLIGKFSAPSFTACPISLDTYSYRFHPHNLISALQYQKVIKCSKFVKMLS